MKQADNQIEYMILNYYNFHQKAPNNTDDL